MPQSPSLRNGEGIFRSSAISAERGTMMPRNPKNKRLEILLSPEQYAALLHQADIEGYITLQPGVEMETKGAVSEYIRDLFFWHVRGFSDASPLIGRGKYARKKHQNPCPYCTSLNTRFVGDDREEGSDEWNEDDSLVAMWFECRDCGRKFRDN